MKRLDWAVSRRRPTRSGLSNPTVWKQVHALERELKAKLVVPYGRGCRLTDGGRELAKLAAPVVASLASLKRQVDGGHGS